MQVEEKKRRVYQMILLWPTQVAAHQRMKPSINAKNAGMCSYFTINTT
jgi:hypothetical protein